MRKENDSILFFSQKAIVLVIVPVGVFSRNPAFLHWLRAGSSRLLKRRREGQVSIVRPDIKVKSDSMPSGLGPVSVVRLEQKSEKRQPAVVFHFYVRPDYGNLSFLMLFVSCLSGCLHASRK